MKKQDAQQRVGVGVSSVLMILVVLAMTALSLLAFGSARSNESMTRRNADIATGYYVAAEQAQQKLAQVDAVLLAARSQNADLYWYEANSPEGVIWEETEEGVSFSFTVETAFQQAVSIRGLVTEGTARYQLLEHRVVDSRDMMDNQYLVLMGD